MTQVSHVSRFLVEISVWAVPTLFAIVAHEVAHGLVARLMGDDTAARAGRLTLSPMRHIDPVGTVLLPAAMLFLGLPVFGYARPVPVDFSKLRRPRVGTVLVAAAGPLTNLVLATASAAAFRFLLNAAPGDRLLEVTVPVIYMLRASVIVNVVLMVFNLLPILPLDGGRVLVGLLPPRLALQYAKLEPYGLLLVFGLLLTDSVSRTINPIIGVVVRALL